MLPRNHVSRNQISQPTNPQHYNPRLHSTPQPIPQNTTVHQLQQRGGVAARNFPGFSPAQSPQQHGQYNPSPSMYAMNPSEMNVPNPNMIGQSPSTNPHPNGQSNMWQQHPMQYVPQPQHSQPQQQNAFIGGAGPMPNKFVRPHPTSGIPFQNYQNPSNVAPSSSSYYYPPGHGAHPPQRFPAPSTQPIVSPSGHSNVPSSSAALFHPNPQYFRSQIPVAGYNAPYESPMYPSSSPQMMNPTSLMHPPLPQMPVQVQPPAMQQPPPPQAPVSQRKVITIKDPNTLQDVTENVLQSGRQSESDAPIARPPSNSAAAPQSDPIAVQFAKQVAAAATSASEQPSPSNLPPAFVSGQGDVAHLSPHIAHPIKSASQDVSIPSGIDTSVPPPPMPMTPLSMSPASTQLHVAQHGFSPKQALPSFATAPSSLPSGSPKMTQFASSAQPNSPGSRPVAPVAVVQPVLHTQATEVVPIEPDIVVKPAVVLPPKVDTHAGQKIEEIIRTTRTFDANVRDLVTDQMLAADMKKSNEQQTPPSIERPNDEARSTPSEDAPAPDSVHLPDAGDRVMTSDQPTFAPEAGVVDEKSNAVEPEGGRADFKLLAAPETASIDPEIADEQGDIPVPSAARAEPETVNAPLSSGDSELTEASDRARSEPMFREAILQQEGSANKNKDAPPIASLTVGDASLDNVLDRADTESPRIDVFREDESAAILTEPADESASDKIVYEREFLMQFRFHNSSMKKPTGLPQIEEITRDGPLPKSSISSSLPSYRDGQTDFTPTWMRGSGPKGGRQSSRGSRSGQQRPGGYGMGYNNPPAQPKMIITKSIQKEPELNKAENAWKPSKFEPKPAGAPLTEEEQTEEVLKNVRAILNKLTPQKFQPLLLKFQQLPINSEVRLREVTNLIFEKAIDEPSFCEAYANMCRVMSQFKVSSAPAQAEQNATQQPSTVEFRKVLLTRCQREFEKDRANEDILCDLRKKMEEAKTPEEKQSLKEDLESRESKERRRMLGNIRFIGELFKLQMLTETIMHNCLMSLFRKRDDESLESLCRLLMTIGKGLDHAKGKLRMEQYFAQIAKIINERKTSSRVRFMLQDVVDLRLNNWVPRAIKAQGPKTIDQIHQDAKEEKQQMALQQAAAAASAPPVKSQSRGGRMGSRGNNASDDGWTKVPQKPMRIDPLKMKLTKPIQFDESLTLGPNRGKVAWKSGSGSNTTTRTGSGGYSGREPLDSIAPRSSTPTTMNRFSALGGPGNQDSIYFQRPGGRISSQERTKSDSRGSTGSGKGSGRDERLSAVDTVRRLTSAERKLATSSAERYSARPPPTSSDAKLEDARLTKEIKSTIEEYLSIHDIKEASECFDELKLPATRQHVIVKTCLEATLEKSSSHRLSVAKLLSALVRNGKILPGQYLQGVTNNMELALDLQIDLPKVWTCVAEQIFSIFYDSSGKVPLSYLKSMTSPLLDAGKAHTFVCEILKLLIRNQGLNEVLQHWRNNRLSMDDFIGSNNSATVLKYLQSQNLEAFSGSDEALKDFNFYLSNLRKQLNEEDAVNSASKWIKEKVSPDEKMEPAFIRALTTAVCDSAIEEKGNQEFVLNKELLGSRLCLLKQFINDEAMELHAVYALQRLLNQLEQPPNILKQLFNHLYDQDIISDQTFFKWEEEDNPQESEGKGIAIPSVKSFIVWLRSPDDAESDE